MEKEYFNSKGLRIAYNPKMDGYWISLQEEAGNRAYSDFVSLKDFEDLENSDEKGKLIKLLNLNSNVFLGLRNTDLSYMSLFNAIETVKLKEEKEFVDQ